MRENKRNALKRSNKSFNNDLFKIFSGLALACTFSVLPVNAQQIITDGNTNTNLDVNGNVTNVSTSTVVGANAFNSFSKFNVDAGNTVNLNVPGNATNLINLVTKEPSAINGVLNSIKNGSVNGNIFLVNPFGVIVGNQGVINVGSLTVVTPTTNFANNFFNSPGNPNDASVSALLNGTAPINPGAVVNIKGKINAINSVRIDSGDVLNNGEIYTGAEFKQEGIGIGDVVNINTLEDANHVSINGQEIIIKTVNNFVNNGKIVADGGDNVAGGKVSIVAGNDVILNDGSLISAKGRGESSNGGNIYIWGNHDSYFNGGAIIDAQGGDISGDGGFIELSAKDSVFLNGGLFKANSYNGNIGSILVDPTNLTISANNFSDGANLNFEADNSITVASGVVISSRNLTNVNTENHNTALSLGNSGNITFNASTVSFGSGSKVYAHADNGYNGGKIIFKNTDYAGNGNADGDISVDLYDATIKTNGKAYFLSNGYNISIYSSLTNGSVDLSNLSNLIVSSRKISSPYDSVDYRSAASTGNSGSISLSADNIKIGAGSNFYTHANGSYSGNNITIDSHIADDGRLEVAGGSFKTNNNNAVNFYFGHLDKNGTIFKPESIETGTLNTYKSGGGSVIANGSPIDIEITNHSPAATYPSIEIGNLDNIVINGTPLSVTDITLKSPTATKLSGNITNTGNILLQYKDSTDSSTACIALDANISTDGNIKLEVGTGASSNVEVGNSAVVYATGTLELLAPYSDTSTSTNNIKEDSNIGADEDIKIQGKTVNIESNTAITAQGDILINADNSNNSSITINGSLLSTGYDETEILSLTIASNGTTSHTGSINANTAGTDIEVNNNSGNTNVKAGTGGKIDIKGNSITGSGSLKANDGSAIISIQNNYVKNLLLNNIGADPSVEPEIKINGTNYTSNYNNINVTAGGSLGAIIDIDNKVASNILLNGAITSESGSVDISNTGGSILDNSSGNENARIISRNIKLSTGSTGTIGSSNDDIDIIESPNGLLSATTNNSNVYIHQKNGNLYVNKINAGTGNITLASAGSILDVSNGANSYNVRGNNITLKVPYTGYTVGSNQYPLLLDQNGAGGSLSVQDLNVQYGVNGLINIKETNGNLPIYCVWGNGANSNVYITADGNITDNRGGGVNILGKSITLTSINGTIGASDNKFEIGINEYTSGGTLTAITNAEDQGIYLNQYCSRSQFGPYPQDLLINSVNAGNGTGDIIITTISGYAVGGIIDGTNSGTASIIGKDITLITQDSTQARNIGQSTSDYLEIQCYGNLTATTNNGNIFIKETSGNLNINNVSAGTGDVTLTSASGIYDGNSGSENANIVCNNLSITSNSHIGTIATDADLDIDAGSSGVLTVNTNGYGNVFIEEKTGNINVNSINAGAGWEVRLATSSGAILDNSTGDANPNVIGYNILLSPASNGSIGTSGEDLDIDTKGGNLLVGLSYGVNGVINIEESSGSLPIYYVWGTGDNCNMYIKADGSITDSRSGNGNLFGKSITLESVSGSIGSVSAPIKIATNYSASTNDGTLTATTSANNDIYINQYYSTFSPGTLNIASINAGSGAGNIDISCSVGGIVDDASGTASITGKSITLTTQGGAIGTSTSNYLDINTGSDTTKILTASSNNGNIFIKETSGDLYLNSVNAGSANVTLASAGNLLDSSNGANSYNVAGNNITLKVPYTGYTVGSSQYPLLLDQNGATGSLTVQDLNTLYGVNGLINIKETNGNLPIFCVWGNGNNSLIYITADGNITDNRGGGVNILGKSITLTSTNGTIGASDNKLEIGINEYTSGGTLTAITNTEDQGIYLNQYCSRSQFGAYPQDLLINSINAGSGTGDIVITTISGYAVGGIIDGTDTGTASIIGNDITLITQDSTQARNIGQSTSDYLEIQCYGNLTATTNNGNIFIKQTNGNLNVNSVNAGSANVTLASAGNILDSSNGANSYNVAGNNITLKVPYSGYNVGTSQYPLLLNQANSTGRLIVEDLNFQYGVNGLINVKQNSTNPLRIDYIWGNGSNSEAKISALGNIVDDRFTNGAFNPCVFAKKISVESTSGTIGSSNAPFKVAINEYASGGTLTATTNNQNIYIKHNCSRSGYPNDLSIYSVNAGTGNVDILSTVGGIVDGNSTNENANIVGNNITLTSTATGETIGAIGTDNDLDITCNGTLTATSPGAMYISSGSALTLGNIETTSSGDINITAASNIVLAGTVYSHTSTSSFGDINITATSSTITNNTASNVINVEGNDIVLTGSSVGTSEDPIEVKIHTVGGDTGSVTPANYTHQN